MAHQNPPEGNHINHSGKFTLGGRTTLLSPVYIKQFTSGFLLYEQLVLTSITPDYYRTPMTAYNPKLIYASEVFCRIRLYYAMSHTMQRQSVLLVGELVARYLPTSRYLPRNIADAEYKRLWSGIIGSTEIQEFFPRLTTLNWSGAPDAEKSLRTANDLPAEYPFEATAAKNISLNQLHNFVLVLMNYMNQVDTENVGLEIITNLIVSIVKKGTFSVAFMEKVKNSLKGDLGKDVRLSINLITAIWEAYGQYITCENIGPLLRYLTTNVMTDASRLVITIDQAKFQALTVYYTIGRAVLKNPMFNWSVIEKLAPGETARYTQSLETVNADQYYGYSYDLELVKSKNFKCLGYIAKELLVKLNGEKHLNLNKSFIVKPPYLALVDKLITMYVDQVESKILQPDQPVKTNAMYGKALSTIANVMVTSVQSKSRHFSE